MTDDRIDFQGKRILVSDIDDSIVGLLSDVFVEEGATVIEAIGGEASLEAVKTGRFDLIIQALVMPNVDGWDVLSFVRARRPELLGRMILMTGYTYDPYTVRRIHNLQMPALFKPFDLDELRKTAHETLYVAELNSTRSAA
jgi:DNA-binding NtrC family response regulator